MRHGWISSAGFGTLAVATALAIVAVAAAQEPPPPPVPVPYSGQGPANDPGEGEDGGGGEVLTRGPVHEAFAGPVVFNPTAGPVVPKAPPGRIEELPPDQKPEGNDVEWIPGYWQWDDDRQDFLWISGIWRIMPPGRQWIPGYWDAARGGYRWVSGYWGPTEQQAVDYLPQPPATLEVGPNVPAPGPQGYAWAPGYWQWIESRYLWRPGVWVQTYPEWIWVPPSYVYTPSGCIFIPGYWDYALARRGLLFAPVYFPAQVYAQPAFVYTPTININITLLTSHFFARPVCRHYYFGDYYAASYSSAGYVPWFDLYRSPVGYDPIYAWSAATYTRQDTTWVTRVHETYRYRVDHVEARPERTFAAQQRLVGHRQDAGARDLMLARTMAQTAAAENHRFRLERIDQAHRAEFARREQRLTEYRDLRIRRESELRAQHHPQGDHAARRIDLPRSPLVATPPAAAVVRERRQEALHDLQERRHQAQAEAVQRHAGQRDQGWQETRQYLDPRHQREQAAEAAQHQQAQERHQQRLREQAQEQQRLQQAEARRQEQHAQLRQPQAAAEQARQQQAALQHQELRRRHEQALQRQQAEAQLQQQHELRRQQAEAAEKARRQQAMQHPPQGQPQPGADPQRHEKAKRGGHPR